jgi:putative ABC transport system permease protein
MIRNYFKIGWRNMMKNKFFSFINIFGLSVGLACCMLIALYLNYETSFDTQHKNAPNIYQVITAFVQNGSNRTENAKHACANGRRFKTGVPRSG